MKSLLLNIALAIALTALCLACGGPQKTTDEGDNNAAKPEAAPESAPDAPPAPKAGGQSAPAPKTPALHDGEGKVCAPKDPLPACAAGADKDAIDGAELDKQKESLAGKAVKVRDALIQGISTCTAKGCSPQVPCCNACSASVSLASASKITLDNRADDGRFGCSGDNCTMCCGVNADDMNKNALITGTLTKTDLGIYTIGSPTVCLLP